ncbi:MAG TPA: hypothetical protein VEV44_09200, partial [Pseudoneobacillus sp.]|nr:hypothetical protein [Pseudoneobacillus sp.]
ITSQMESMGKKVRWVHEVARPHPTLYFDEACLLLEEYNDFLLKYPNAKKILDKVKIKRGNTISIDLLEVEWKYFDQIGSDTYEALKTYNVWNFSLEKYMEIALEKWEFFVDYVKQEPGVTFILDSSIFQFQIYTFLAKNAPIHLLKDFIIKLFTLVSSLHPSLIYLFRENVENSISYIERKRGVHFLEEIWKRDCHQPYYQDKPKGADGYREFLRDYHKIARELYYLVPFKKLAVDITMEDWHRCNSEIKGFLSIEEEKMSFQPNYYYGLYTNEELDLYLEVRGDHIIDPAGSTKKIYPRSVNEFYIEDLPIILHFNSDERLTILGDQLIARWTTYGLEYRKL